MAGVDIAGLEESGVEGDGGGSRGARGKGKGRGRGRNTRSKGKASARGSGAVAQGAEGQPANSVEEAARVAGGSRKTSGVIF